jgi:hypothetical protein
LHPDSLPKRAQGPLNFVIARSKTVGGVTVKEEFHIRIEGLHDEEKVPGIIQSKAKADLGSQHAATFVEGQCQTFDRLLESRVPGFQDLHSVKICVPLY